MCLRRSVKARARTDVGESLEDARIWATDMSPGGHYEKINMASVGGSQQYETIRTTQTQVTRQPEHKVTLGSLVMMGWRDV